MDANGVRRRKADVKEAKKDQNTAKSEAGHGDSKLQSTADRLTGSSSFWLTRIVFLRSLGFIYFVAFLVALHQNRALVGEKGVLPTTVFLNKIRDLTHTPKTEVTTAILDYAPTILWYVDVDQHLDWWLDAIAYGGLALSSLVLVLGCSNMVIMSSLWVLYHSLVNIGQTWYSFGWESQLLETGFLAIFMCPLLTLRRFPRHTPTPWVALWGYRWMIFRIMIGAGLIKIRGDQCWRDLTCMNYHYETQPVPNPLSYYLHQTPVWFHKFETLSNHFVELVAPIFLLVPWRPFRLTGGVIQVLFQVVLILSGNLSFLNWLTILPAIACFDDQSLAWLFPSWLTDDRQTAKQIHMEEENGIGPKANQGDHIRRVVHISIALLIAYLSIPLVKNILSRCQGDYIRKVVHISLALLIAYLSIPVVKNLLSKRQAMNTSFNSLRIVNTYGAFGSITKQRTEVIFQGTSDSNPNSVDTVWREYEFKCKPGNLTRRPCLISPYHYRLDWLMWFAAFQTYHSTPWLIHLSAKLLMNDEQVLDLIAHNPFPDEPPKFLRAEHYRYTYTQHGSKEALAGQWWKRSRLDPYMPVVSLEAMESYLNQQRWELPKHIKKRIKDERIAKARGKPRT